MVGTSGALRILYETERAGRRGRASPLRLDERRVVEGGALSTAATSPAGFGRTLADRAARSPGAIRRTRAHVFFPPPFSGGERSTGWDPHATGSVHGLTFATTPLDLARRPSRASAYRFAAIAAASGIEQVVATGGRPPERSRLDPINGRRTRPPGHGVRRLGGIAPRRSRGDARAARLPD